MRRTCRARPTSGWMPSRRALVTRVEIISDDWSSHARDSRSGASTCRPHFTCSTRTTNDSSAAETPLWGLSGLATLQLQGTFTCFGTSATRRASPTHLTASVYPADLRHDTDPGHKTTYGPRSSTYRMRGIYVARSTFPRIAREPQAASCFMRCRTGADRRGGELDLAGLSYPTRLRGETRVS